MLKELFEFRIAKDALRIYNLSNVDKSWTPTEPQGNKPD